MIFCHEFLLLATKGPRQHGHCGRPRSVAQDFTCFRAFQTCTHIHRSRRASCRAVPCKQYEGVPLATRITKCNERSVPLLFILRGQQRSHLERSTVVLLGGIQSAHKVLICMFIATYFWCKRDLVLGSDRTVASSHLNPFMIHFSQLA